MKRRLSTLVLSALAVAAVGGFATLHAGPAAHASTWWYTEDSELVSQTHPVSGSFANISVTNYYADVDFRISRDGAISVVTRDFSDITYTVAVNNNTLTISRPEPSATSLRFFRADDDDDPEIVVYLPAGSYGSLTVSSTSGDIETSNQLGFASAKINTVSGDIELNGPVTGDTNCTTTSGDVELNGPTLGNVRLSTTSGDLELTGCYIQSLDARSVSGDVDLERVTAAGEVIIETTSGDIELEQSDAGALTLSSTSGEVEASLLSAKNFSVSSMSGRVSVPASDPGAGACAVRTISGSIRITVR